MTRIIQVLRSRVRKVKKIMISLFFRKNHDFVSNTNFLVKNDSPNHFFAFFRHEESPESQMSLNPYEKLDNLAVLGTWKSQRIMNFAKKSFFDKGTHFYFKNGF